MKKFALPVLVLAAVLAASALIIAGPSRGGQTSATAIVKQAALAGTKYSYSATGKTSFLYRGRMMTADIKLFHKKPNMCRIEYLSEPLKGVIVGNDQQQSWRYDPKLRKITILGDFSCGRHSADLGLMLGNYSVESAGKATVAGRPASVLNLKCRTGKLKKRVWADTSTSVVLRLEDYNCDGRMMSSTEFKSIKLVNNLPDSLFKRPAEAHATVRRKDSARLVSAAELSKEIGFQVTKPRYVPRGYKLDGYRTYVCQCACGHPGAYSRYTNGLNSISIFETRPASGQCQMQNEQCAVQDTEPGHVARISAHGRDFVIVADLSHQELQKIAASLR